MKKLTQKNLYVAVVAGLGVLSAPASFAGITDYDSDADFGGDDDSTVWYADLTNETVEIYGAPGLDLSGNPVVGGTVRVRADGLVSPLTSDHITMTPRSLEGKHTGPASQSNWTFDESGFSDNINDAPGGGTNTNMTARIATQTEEKIESAPGVSNTSTRTAASTVNTITDGANTSRFTQNAAGFELGGNLAVAAGKTINMGGNRVQGVADGIDNADAANMRQVREVDTRVNETNNRIDVVNTRVDDTNVRINTANTRTDETNVRIDTANTRIDETNVRINAANTRIDDTNVRIDTINTNLNNHIVNTGARFDDVNNRIGFETRRLDKKIAETGAVAAAFAQLGQSQTPGKSTFGIAAGGQGGKAGVAIGFSYRPVTMKPVVIKASLGASGKTVAGGIGATWEF